MLGKLRLLLWVGIIVLFLPFYGVPDWIRTIVTIGMGTLLIYLAFVLKFGYKKIRFQLRQCDKSNTEETVIHG